MKQSPKISLKNKILFSVLATMGAGLSFQTVSQTTGSTTPTIAPVSLAHTPLHSATTMDKPTMALALSVEFPTVGSQYRDATYSAASEYIGYYDAESCYQYIDTPTETPVAPKTTSDYKRFKFASAASNRQCTGETFSGNFLNWASSSAIDMLRMALSGGDRYIDEDGLTILQRAVLPSGTPECFWNHSSYFPARSIASSNNFQGAIPESMRTKAGTNTIWVANKLNQIYFKSGSTSSGSCTDTSAYNLGKIENLGPSRTESSRPSTAQACDGGTCTFTGIKEVWYGRNSNWIVRPAKDGVACNQATLGNPGGSGTKSCYIYDYKGNWQPTGLNSDGYFFARAEVCGTNNAGSLIDQRDYNFCQQYPNGKYKPTGVIQKYSDNLRLSAFGYLMDQTTRYGGVLRAPMKYVGPKTFNIYGREEVAPNARQEWNTQTGIFVENPEGDTNFSHSGVINYLNKFGRTGATAGVYKQYDTLAELYYQSLRYLQGLQPTPDAVSGLSSNRQYYDGFPAYDDWSNLDPYGNGRSSSENYACLKSNIVVVGDIYTHEGDWRNIPTNGDVANNVPNFRNWLNKINQYEVANFSNSSFLTNRTRNQIAGYAYWAHTNDIRGTGWTSNPDKQRPGLRVKTFFFDVNENSGSSSLATRSTSNPFFMGAKYGGFENDPRNVDDNPYSVDDRPDRDANGVKDNTVWRRTSGDASTYYLQSDARGVLTAFDDIFNRASSAAQSISQSAASTSSVNATTDSHVYTGTYDIGSWTGNVVAKRIVMDSTTKNITLQEDSSWNPGNRLNTRTTDRNIVIGLGSAEAAVNFEWSALQGTTAEEPLSKSSVSATPDAHGAARVGYLRGERNNEGVLFRTRLSLLGDIINAGVTYSGPPTNKFSDKSYQLFLAANKDRLPIVVTGANDGMLHAFAAETKAGVQAADEVFAYIPSWLTPKLSSLAQPDYINNHQAFVDAPSTIGEAQVAFTTGNGSATDWKTVLVSGTGAGGRGVFALDITNPTNFGPSSAIWEFTAQDDSDMGYVVGKPKILKFKTGPDTHRWFAVVASGVNNYQSTFESGNGSGTPSIFLLALDKPVDEAWDLGENYFKISFPLDTTLANTMAPGIIDFSVLWSSNNEVTHIYAGDLHGNVWKLDFTDAATTSKYKPTSSWNLNALSFFKNGTEPLPFFIAQTGGTAAQRQPISAAPLLVTGPIVKGVESFYVLIGTGKYLEASDVSNTRDESFYVLYDDNASAADSTSSSRTSAISGRARLKEATVDSNAKTVTVDKFVWGRAQSDTDNTQRSGWYFDFPETAERMVYSAENIGQFNISFNSIIPAESLRNQSICAEDTASSNIYDLNIQNGGGKYKVSQIGILGPSLFLLNEEKTTLGDIDSTGRAKRTITQERISVGSTGHAVDQTPTITEMVGRLSWRQIYNYKEIKHGSASTTPSTGSNP